MKLLRAAWFLSVLAFALPTAATAKGLSAADRAGIDKTLDRFVATAVRRIHPLSAWNLAAPSLRAGTTRAQWRRGDLPAYPYPARGRQFHYWNYSFRNGREVGIELQLHSQHPYRIGPITFKVSLEKIRGRWLVSSFMPAATFAPLGAAPKVRSQADFAAGSMNEPSVSKPKLGAVWIVAPLSVLALSVLIAVCFPLVRWGKERLELRRT